MPRKSIKSSSRSDFELKKRNPVSLGNDSNLDNDFKPLRVGGIDTGLELKKGEIKSTASNFVTLQETTEILNVTKIRGNRTGSQEVPNFIFQNADPSSPDNGLWLNIASAGLTILKTSGTNAHMVQQAEASFMNVGGADDGDLVRWQRGTSWLSPDNTVMDLDLYNTNLTIYNRTNESDYFKIDVGEEGATTISTVDDDTTVGHLTLDADGSIDLDAANVGLINLKNAGTLYGTLSVHHNASWLELYENGGASTVDSFKIATYENAKTVISTTDGAGEDAHLIFQPDGSFLVQEKAAAGADLAGYGQLWVRSSTPNDLYFVDDTGQETRITNDGSLASSGGGTSRWSRSIGGYKTNNNSSSSYYMNYYNGFYGWTASDSSPTSLSYSNGSRCGVFHAPADGTLTNIRISLYALDTGLTDPLKFYVYKGTISDGGSSVSTTLIGTSDTITPVVSDTMFESKDFSSSNSFSEGDTLYVMLKKDSTSGNQDVYFSVTISGEYD
tara:strand:+ start:5729 stop:7228 length:1500 start_codon:yes stop_codon:yes gene_type:complete